MEEQGSYTIHEAGAFIWLRLKAIIWDHFGLEYPGNLRSNSGNTLAQIWKRHSSIKTVIVNCQGITSIDQHALEEVNKHSSSAKRSIVFTSDSPTFLEDLEHALDKPKAIIHLGKELRGYVYGKQCEKPPLLKSYVAEGANLEEQATARLVGNCFEYHTNKKEVRMHSTPFKSVGLFNARSLIGDPKGFNLLMIQMAERLERLLQKYCPENPRILSVSLRGSPIAAATAFLATPRLDVQIVDHMGPKQMIMEEYTFDQQPRDISYIYVGDFIIGGTELKVASSYARALGSRVTHALVIGTLLESSEYGQSTPIDSLVSLTKCHKGLRYSLT